MMRERHGPQILGSRNRTEISTHWNFINIRGEKPPKTRTRNLIVQASEQFLDNMQSKT